MNKNFTIGLIALAVIIAATLFFVTKAPQGTSEPGASQTSATKSEADNTAQEDTSSRQSGHVITAGENKNIQATKQVTGQVTDSAPSPSAAVTSAAPSSNSTSDDRVLGNTDAPITIIEYSSLSCGHCALFHKEVLPDVTEKLIDTGKAKLVMRDFPLNIQAFHAAQLTRCVPAERYWGLVDILFKNQDKWLGSQDYINSLKQTGRLAGLSNEAFDACIADEALQNRIIAAYQDGQTRWEVSSTPTFVFLDANGTLIDSFSGARDIKAFEDVINKALQ